MTFDPLLPGLIVLLPLVGFFVNGWLALSHGRRSADAVRGVTKSTWPAALAR